MQVPVEWTHATLWRQGHVLCADACMALGLKHPDDPEATCVVVIGHDCDLANHNLEAEPVAEAIVGRIVSNAAGSFSWGKSPRTLHLEMRRAGTVVTVELVAPKKVPLLKSALAAFNPDNTFVLEAKHRSVLRNWLSARYNRTAFSDTFVNRMKSTKVDVRLAKLLEPKGPLISFIYFKLNEGESIEREDGDPYELSIVLVYPPGDDPADSAERADALADEVLADCQKRLTGKEGGQSKEIILKTCFAISEDELTVAQARELAQWRLEYMSLRADDDQTSMLQL
jgi:hypothetical protein